MSYLSPLSEKALEPLKFLFRAVKKSMGFETNSIKIMARNRAILASFSTLVVNIIGDPDKISPITGLKLSLKNMGWTAKNLRSQDRVPLYLRNLVSHVSSNATGCRYCQAHTITEAMRHGASEEKLKAVWDFENSPVFDAKEKAALRFGLAAGSVPNAVREQHFADLREHFTEAQIVDLGATVALFGFLNRWNDTFGTTLEAEPKAIAEKYLVKSGWEIGKHG